MPGGFTFADFFAGFSDAALIALTLGRAIVVAAFVLFALFGLSVLIGRAFTALGKDDSPTDLASVKAMARERMYRDGAAVDTGDWGQDDIYSDQTHRRAS